MKILGIDHATVHAGMALMVDGQFGGFEPIELSKSQIPPMLLMYRFASAYIKNLKPDIIALEKPMALRNGDIARKLIEVYSACKLAALEAGIEPMELAPQLAKIHTVGHGAADKENVARALQAKYGLDYDKIAIPVYYKDKKRAGQVRERLYDVSDAAALCVAAWEIKRREGRQDEMVGNERTGTRCVGS